MARTKTGEAEQKWRGHLESWDASGLTLRGFAAREGLNPNTLWGWKRRLRGTRTSAPSFVPVSVTPTKAESASVFELVVGDGVVLRIPAHFDEAYIPAAPRRDPRRGVTYARATSCGSGGSPPASAISAARFKYAAGSTPASFADSMSV